MSAQSIGNTEETDFKLENYNDHLTDVIIRYVKEDSSNPYALMITGDWGAGKTYYQKNILSEKIKKHTEKKTVYISLNGLKSSSEASEQLFFGLLDNKSSTFSAMAIKLGRVALQAGRRILKLNESDFKAFELNDFVDLSKCVLVFDDLERLSSSLSPSEILGFINTCFVEHYKIKVLIICNEKEIAVEYKEKYKKEKEKVVGRTIEFKLDVNQTINTYIESINEGDFKNFVEKNKLFIFQQIKQAQITNLRTLFFFFDRLKAILDELPQDLKDKFGNQIALWTLIYSDEYKNGVLSDYSEAIGFPPYYNLQIFDFENIVFKENEPEGFQTITKVAEENKDKQEEYYKKYRPSNHSLFRPIPGIITFIETGYLDIELIIKLLRNQVANQAIPKIEALRKINPFDDSHLALNDEEFTTYLSTVNQAVFYKKYSFSQFIKAFQTLVKLEEEGFLALTENELLEKYTDIEDFFVKNLWETKDALEYWEFTLDIQLTAQRDGFEFLMPIKYSSLYHKVKEIYDSLESKYIKEEYEKKFPSFDTNPFSYEIPWNDLELLIQVADIDELSQLIKSALFNTPKQLCEIFRDWPPSKKKVTIIKLDVILEKVEDIKTNMDEYRKVIDFSGKPMSKHWLNQLIPHSQRKIDLLKGLLSTSS